MENAKWPGKHQQSVGGASSAGTKVTATTAVQQPRKPEENSRTAATDDGSLLHGCLLLSRNDGRENSGKIRHRNEADNSPEADEDDDDDDDDACDLVIKQEEHSAAAEDIHQRPVNNTTTISENAKQLIQVILEHMKDLNNTEKYLLYLKIFQITTVVDPLRQPLNPLGSRLEINRTISWIRTHLEEDLDISLPKQEVYDEYSGYCLENNIKSLSQADFGKVMKQVYPNVKARRLGTRGNSKYCYSGLRRCVHLTYPLMPDVADKPMSTEVPCATLSGGNLMAAAWLIVKEWSEQHFNLQFKSLHALACFLVLNFSIGVGTEAANQVTLPGASGGANSTTPDSPKKAESMYGRNGVGGGNKHREMQLQLQKKIQQKNEVKEQRKRKTQSPKCDSSSKKSKQTSSTPTTNSDGGGGNCIANAAASKSRRDSGTTIITTSSNNNTMTSPPSTLMMSSSIDETSTTTSTTTSTNGGSNNNSTSTSPIFISQQQQHHQKQQTQGKQQKLSSSTSSSTIIHPICDNANVIIQQQQQKKKSSAAATTNLSSAADCFGGRQQQQQQQQQHQTQQKQQTAAAPATVAPPPPQTTITSTSSAASPLPDFKSFHQKQSTTAALSLQLHQQHSAISTQRRQSSDLLQQQPSCVDSSPSTTAIAAAGAGAAAVTSPTGIHGCRGVANKVAIPRLASSSSSSSGNNQQQQQLSPARTTGKPQQNNSKHRNKYKAIQPKPLLTTAVSPQQTMETTCDIASYNPQQPQRHAAVVAAAMATTTTTVSVVDSADLIRSQRGDDEEEEGEGEKNECVVLQQQQHIIRNNNIDDNNVIGENVVDDDDNNSTTLTTATSTLVILNDRDRDRLVKERKYLLSNVNNASNNNNNNNSGGTGNISTTNLNATTSSDDCDVSIFPLPRARLDSISNVDKDAMDAYLGTSNSQHEEELSKYFSTTGDNANVAAVTATTINCSEAANPVVMDNTPNSADDTPTTKLSQLRQLLELNGISASVVHSNGQQNSNHGDQQNRISAFLPPQTLLEETNRPGGLSTRKNSSINNNPCQSQIMTADGVQPNVISSQIYNMAATQQNTDIQVSNNLTSSVNNNDITQIIASQASRRRVSFELSTTSHQSEDSGMSNGSAVVPPSPNTRRKNFSFTPISPAGPQSPSNNNNNNNISNLNDRHQSQANCSSTNVSPFVSPRNTPVPRMSNKSHQNPAGGGGGGGGIMLAAAKNLSNFQCKIKKEPDLTLDLDMNHHSNHHYSNNNNNNLAMSAPASPMLLSNHGNQHHNNNNNNRQMMLQQHESVLQKLLNNSKVEYRPDYMTLVKLERSPVHFIFKDEMDTSEVGSELCSPVTPSDHPLTPSMALSVNGTNSTHNNYRSQSVPLHQMINSGTATTITNNNTFNFLSTTTTALPTSHQQNEFTDFDPISSSGGEQDSDVTVVNNIISSLDEPQNNGGVVGQCLPAFNFIVNNNNNNNLNNNNNADFQPQQNFVNFANAGAVATGLRNLSRSHSIDVQQLQNGLVIGGGATGCYDIKCRSVPSTPLPFNNSLTGALLTRNLSLDKSGPPTSGGGALKKGAHTSRSHPSTPRSAAAAGRSASLFSYNNDRHDGEAVTINGDCLLNGTPIKINGSTVENFTYFMPSTATTTITGNPAGTAMNDNNLIIVNNNNNNNKIKEERMMHQEGVVLDHHHHHHHHSGPQNDDEQQDEEFILCRNLQNSEFVSIVEESDIIDGVVESSTLMDENCVLIG